MSVTNKTSTNLRILSTKLGQYSQLVALDTPVNSSLKEKHLALVDEKINDIQKITLSIIGASDYSSLDTYTQKYLHHILECIGTNGCSDTCQDAFEHFMQYTYSEKDLY